jgi:peptidoglycan-associated lipoprotein
MAAALLSPAMPGGVTLRAHADPTQNSPAEMLQDGLEALIERQTELATQLFEHVIQAFPGTPEATHAERELGKMSGATPDTAERTRNVESVANDGLRFSTAELRMKFAVEAGDRVFFAENSAVIGGRARSLLEQQARWLIKRPELKVTVVGRADDGNAPEAARDISTKRAEAVRDRLVANGVAVSRIAIEARGMRDPVATCRSALCQAQNRHAETIIGTAAAADISGGGGPVSR